MSSLEKVHFFMCVWRRWKCMRMVDSRTHAGVSVKHQGAVSYRNFTTDS